MELKSKGIQEYTDVLKLTTIHLLGNNSLITSFIWILYKNTRLVIKNYFYIFLFKITKSVGLRISIANNRFNKLIISSLLQYE